MKLNIQLFAASKSTTFTEPTLTDANISDNKSTLKIKITFSANNNVTFFSGKTLSCTCNGSTQTKSVSLAKGGDVSKTFTFEGISHDDDGTKTVSWSWSCATGTSVLGTISDSGTKILQEIPRASEITSVSDGTTPYYPTIIWTPKNDTFIYGVEFKNSSNTTIHIGGNVFPNRTTPYTYNQLGVSNDDFSGVDSEEQTITAVLETKNSNYEPVGEKTKTFTATLDSSIKPTVSISNLAEADSTMISKNWGVYVKGKSKLSYRINYSFPSPVPTSATITSSTNNEDFSSNATISTSAQTKTFTTKVLGTAGSNTITARATDSRTRYTDATSQTYTVVDYFEPKITTAEARRVNSNNVEDTDGQYLSIKFVGEIASVSNKNAKGFLVGYREKGTNTSFTYKTISSGYTVSQSSWSSYLTGADWEDMFDKDKAYEIVFEARDSFRTSSNPVKATRYLDTGFDLMNFNASGKAMAIGKVSEATGNNELLEIALPTTITNTLYTNNMIKSEVSTGEPTFRAKRTDTNVAVDMLVGSGGTNHGIYSRKLDKWMIYGDNNNINLSGGQITINSDGDLTKKLTLQQGSTVRYFNGGGGTTGYMKVATLTITQTYMNQPIIFEITQRSRRGVLYLQFTSGNTTDPSITDFSQTGKIQCYIKKTATSTWDLYIQKSEAYDNIEVCRLHKGNYSSGVTISWNSRGTTVSSLPSDYQTATGASILQTTTGNLTINKTSGNATATGTWARNGEIICYDITLTTTGSTTSGGDIFVGEITNFTPKKATTLVGYVGVRPIIAQLGTDKKITVRNASASSLGSGSSPSIRGTFIRG